MVVEAGRRASSACCTATPDRASWRRTRSTSAGMCPSAGSSPSRTGRMTHCCARSRRPATRRIRLTVSRARSASRKAQRARVGESHRRPRRRGARRRRRVARAAVANANRLFRCAPLFATRSSHDLGRRTLRDFRRTSGTTRWRYHEPIALHRREPLLPRPPSKERFVSLKIVQTDKGARGHRSVFAGCHRQRFSLYRGPDRARSGVGSDRRRRRRAQTERVLTNLDAVLATVGASWKDVVKTTVFLHDMNDFPRVNEVYGDASATRDRRDRRSRSRRCRAAFSSRSTLIVAVP